MEIVVTIRQYKDCENKLFTVISLLKKYYIDLGKPNYFQWIICIRDLTYILLWHKQRLTEAYYWQLSNLSWGGGGAQSFCRT